MRLPKNWIKEYIDLPEDRVFTDKMSMIGHMLDKEETINGETVGDFELRGNRADCYSIIGLAREGYAAFGGRFDIVETKIKLPADKPQEIKIDSQSKVIKRFYSCVIKGVKVGPSPKWMQDRLIQMGIDPINNLVDITNYVMFETGMPLHAFDLAKLGGKSLILRPAKKGEKFTSFDGTNLELTDQDIVFAGENGAVHGLVGILGGKESGISETTTDILLECAAYDRVSIRKTMYKHNAMTEAGLRHSHDLSASLCDYTLARAAEFVLEIAGGEIEGMNDYYPDKEKEKVIDYDPSEVTRLGGVEVPKLEQIEILKRLDFVVEESGKDKLKVTVPLFRTDIYASEDLVEEVLRIWGYEKIPFTTLSSVIPDPIKQAELELEERSRDVLTSLGLNEVITVPFLTEKTMQNMGDPMMNRSIPVINPPTTDFTHLRSNMFANLLEAAKKVLERGDSEAKFFESGKIYLKKEGKMTQPPHKADFPYVELRQIGGLMITRSGEASYSNMKGILEEYFVEMKIRNVKFIHDDVFPFIKSAKAVQGDKILAWVGVVDPKISKDVYDITQDVYGIIINAEELVNAEFTEKSFLPYSDYPEVTQDMSVQVSTEVLVGDMVENIKSSGGEILRDVVVSEVYEMNEKEKSVLFSMAYQSKERTLTTKEVNDLHVNIGKLLEKEFSAKIR